MARFGLVFLLLLSGCLGRGEQGRAPVVHGEGAGHDIELPTDWRVAAGRVAPRATLASLLRGHGVGEGEIAAAIGRAAAVCDVKKLRAAQPYRVSTMADGALRSLDD